MRQSIQITKLKIRQYHLGAVSPNLMLAKLSRYTVIIISCFFHIVIADVVAFIAIVIVDLPLPDWVYPFIFYIQVIKGLTITHYS